MSATDATPHELTDPELISRVREGDVDAYGTLFSRHVDAATRLARLLVGPSDADDLVSEAFVKVLNVLLGGGGPDVAFRAYLLTAVRRLHIDKVRSTAASSRPTDDLTPFDPGVPFTDTAVAGFEGGAAAKAFASLPERWQMVLWHLEVENQKPADIAPLLGMSANSVSALAYRAREGLRQAFLTMHSGDLVSDDCRETNDLLGGYVRRALSRRDTTKVEDHLDHCRRCTARLPRAGRGQLLARRTARPGAARRRRRRLPRRRRRSPAPGRAPVCWRRSGASATWPCPTSPRPQPRRWPRSASRASPASPSPTAGPSESPASARAARSR